MKENTFKELVEEATRNIHSALLIGGAKEMKSEIYIQMNKAILWSMDRHPTYEVKHERKNNK
jgi:hypothetical protein